MKRIKNTIVCKAIASLLIVSMLLTGIVIPSVKADASNGNIAADATISAENYTWASAASWLVRRGLTIE